MKRAALLVAGLLVAGCRTPIALAPLPPDDPRPERLLAAWEREAKARRGLRGRARLAVDARDGAVRLRGKQVIALERPGRLRVEVKGLLDQTLLVLVTDGGRYQLLRADDHSYREGPVTPTLLWEQAWIDLTPTEAIDLLLGAPAADASLVPLAALGDDGGGVRLDLGDAEGQLRRRAGFDAAGRLLWLEVYDAPGALRWRAEYGDFERLGTSEFARAVKVETAAGATRAEISLRGVELNPPLAPELFRLPVPAAAAPRAH